MPGPGYFWVGGYWGWTGADWAWYGGRWTVAPQGRVYVEPITNGWAATSSTCAGTGGLATPLDAATAASRIRFVAPVRPANYRHEDRPHFERRAGVAPGARPATFYQRAAGPARPIPRATAPSHRMVAPTNVRENVAPVQRGGAEPGRPAGGEHMAGGVGPRERRRAPAHAGSGGSRPATRQRRARAGNPERPAPRMAPAPRPGPAPRPNTPPPKKRQ